MARILFAAWPYDGHVNPCLAVARALAVRGHEVAVYTGSSGRPQVEADGFMTFPFRAVAAHFADVLRAPSPEDRPELFAALTARYATVDERGWAAKARRIRAMYREMIVDSIPAQVADLESIIGRWRPDVIVADALLWGPFVVLAERCPIPMVVFCFYGGCLVPGPDAPPAGFGLPRPRDWRTRGLATIARVIARAATRDVRQGVDRVRRQHGLAPLGRPVAAHTGRMPLYLVASVPEFDYERRDLPRSVHYVGPCLRDKPGHDPAPAWLDRLGIDRPLVYVSEGTCAIRRAGLLRAAADGLADLPLDVVMTTGRQRSPRSIGPVASNIRVESFVPHSDLFPRASVVVTTGGSGTVRAALSAGVPVVVVPTDWDQLENAQRAVEAGVGCRIPVESCTAQAVKEAVQRVLRDPGYAMNARRLAVRFAAYGGAGRAAELLESLIPMSPGSANAGAVVDPHVLAGGQHVGPQPAQGPW